MFVSCRTSVREMDAYRFPCSVRFPRSPDTFHREFSLEAPDSSAKSDHRIAGSTSEFETANSLYFSLLAGKWRDETGSQLTASSPRRNSHERKDKNTRYKSLSSWRFLGLCGTLWFRGLCATLATTLFTQRRTRPTSKAMAARESHLRILVVRESLARTQYFR